MQASNLETENYENREAMYIPRNVAEDFIKDFHVNVTYGYNGVTALMMRIQEEYIIDGIYEIARRVIKEYLNCQRNKFNKYKLYREL